MSGMVFDITRWLDEHPGGSRIIPEQGRFCYCMLYDFFDYIFIYACIILYVYIYVYIYTHIILRMYFLYAALSVDSTIFFEIYHVSKQSFLYLKEFYIGELSEEDRLKVPLPSNCPSGTRASDAFLEQIERWLSNFA